MELKTVEGVTTYLKNALELESTIYSLEEAKKSAKGELIRKEPQYREPIAPQMLTTAEPAYNPPAVSEIPQKKHGSVVAGIILLVLFFFIGLSATNDWVIILFIIGLWLVIRPFYKYRKELEAREKEINELRLYDEKYLELKKQYEQEKDNYNNKMTVYEQECRKAKDQYQLKTSRYQQAEKAISQLDVPLKATKRALASLYEADVIYPKYHNLISISSFYEYFISGRCSELTGPHGAYNLFEAELRQNIIINRLDKIVSQLEDIKANQYALYMELCEANRISKRVSADVSDILSGKKTQSHIDAVCSAATAKNIEALKYIELIK